MRRVVVALLRLYPERFRRRLGGDLLATFDEQWNESRDWRTGARTVASLASGAALERWNGKGDGKMAELIQDLRFALRVLRRSPGFTALAIIMLASGIGANSSFFSLLDAIRFKPLPFRDSGRLVMLWERAPRAARHRITPLNFADWAEQNHVFDSIAAVSGGSKSFIAPGGAAELVPGQAVTARWFDVLGVRPLFGRTFVAADVKSKPDTVVVSEAFWRSRLNADPNVVGTTLQLDSTPYTVIGVVPAEAQILSRAELWTPFFIPNRPEFRKMHFLQSIGRLRPGATLEQARADMDVIATNISRAWPDTNKGWGITIQPLREALVAPELLNTSMALSGAVGFVLLMACVNVANLLLARGVGRAREMAVRSSIGGSRSRIVRQLFTESTLLAALGGAAGIALASLILRAAPAIAPAGWLPIWLKLSLDWRVVTFAVASAAIAAVFFGLAPAWQTARASLADALRAGGRAATSGGRLRALLAGSEIAVATLLVAGAGLLLRTLLSLDRVDPGCRTDHVITMYVSLPNSRYPKPADVLRFYQSVEREMDTVRGVRSVGMTNILPTEGWDIGQGFQIVGRPTADPSNMPTTHYLMVNAGYFRTLGIAILRGRAFDDRDTGSAEPVCIINEEFARRHFPAGDALGAQISVSAMDPGGPKSVVRRVVGVSAQVKVEGLRETENLSELYVPQAQNAWDWSAIAVRTEGDPRAFASAVRLAIARVDKQQPVTRVRTMEDVVAETVAPTRFRAMLTGAFALGALALAAVGIFGVLAFSVTQRTREFGIRSALGARSGDLQRLVLREAVLIAGAGIAIGLIAAAALTRALASLLFGVKPLDAITFVSAAALLGGAALAASIVPAWRAARVDPAVTLRQD